MPHSDGYIFAMMALVLLWMHVAIFRTLVPLWAQWAIRSISAALVALAIIITALYIWFLKSL